MEFIKIAALTGPNRWATGSVLEAHVDCGPWARRNSAHWPELTASFRAWRPAFEELAGRAALLARRHDHPAAELVRQWTEELPHGLSCGQLLARLTRIFQAGADVLVESAVFEETDEPRVCIVAIPFEEESLGRACLDTARTCLVAAAQGQLFDVTSAARYLVDLADDVRLGPSSRAIVRAARDRGIPFRRLNVGSLVQLGEGRHQRRIWTAETDATSAIAESIAQDKELTKRLLRSVGVPVPVGRPVMSAEDAWQAACEIGPPVVVKPRKANHARGISLDLTTREQVLAAYDWAVTDGENTGVMVEQYARGHAHRLLVVGSRLLAAARGESEYVLGDGVRTIQQLVDEVNQDPRRGENYTDPLNLLKLDNAAQIELRKQGYTPDSIPAAGERVLVQHVGDLTMDCTAEVHPHNAAKAVLAARVVGLDVAGLDVVAEDIGQPLEDQRGAVLEVNAGPSLSMHIAPLHGQPQPVGQAIVDLLFPPHANGRALIMGVTGTGPRAEVARRIEGLLRGPGRHVGRATTEGVYFDGQLIGAALNCDAARFETLVVHPDVDIAIVESCPEYAAAHGIGNSRIDVTVVTDLSHDNELLDSGGPDGRPTIRQGVLAALRGVPRDGVAVLPLVLAAAGDLCGAVRGNLVFFDAAPDAGRKATVLAAGARLVFVRDGKIVLARSEGEEIIRLPDGWSSAQETMKTHLAAIAAAWASGRVAEELR